MMCLLTYFLIQLLLSNVSNGLYNAALYKPAIQSSTYTQTVPPYSTYYAHLAFDGNRDTNMWNLHCQHTCDDYIPWLMVDLRGQFVVDTIIMTNRMEALTYRLQDFQIDIFEQDPRQLTNFPNISGVVCYKHVGQFLQETLITSCPAPSTARFVRLSMNHNYRQYLHICEIEVMVSKFLNGENLFNIKVDTKLTGLILDTLTLTDPSRCIEECLARRSSICTAVNWVTTSKTCQLFSVNPNLDLTSYLTSAQGTHFYIQDNSFKPTISFFKP